MEELVNQFKYLVGGYYGVSLMDEYSVKEYVLQDIENYIRDFIEVNPIDNFDYMEEAIKIKECVSEKVKLQEADSTRSYGSCSSSIIHSVQLKQHNKRCNCR